MGTQEAAEACGVQQSAYSKWENGRTRPGDEALTGIAKFLGLSRAAVILARSTGELDPEIDRADAIEARLDRVELQMTEMIELLRDLDRRIQDRSQGDDEGA